MLQVGRLRVLREIALCGSVTAAANSLSLTPSAVSQQITALEREAGVRLLERRGRGVVLTDPAHALVRRAESILTELTLADADLDAFKHAKRGTLSIGAFPTSGTWLVPSALRVFKALHPEVEIRLTEIDPEQSLPMVYRGEIDLAIAFECDLVPLEATRLEQETLFTEPMLVVHAAGAHTPRNRKIELANLKHEHWIVPAPGSAIHEFTLRACQVAGFRPVIGSVWTDFQVVQSLAAHGYGVAFVPRLALRPPRPGVVARMTSISLQRRVFAAWRSGNARAPLVSAIVAALRDTVEGRDPLVDASTGTIKASGQRKRQPH